MNGLVEHNVRVLLHLVPSLDLANRLPEASARDEWRAFVEGALTQFSGKIEAVEIGNTINRAKWSGYSYEGVQVLWDVAYECVKQAGLPLVGPNVTDFEPQYNAGILAMLGKRDQLPDVHSNNLFVERAGAPEAFDPKICGRTFRKLHRYNLRKKIWLIAAIASKLGVQRNWSTCSFWTLPRIDRFWGESEEQMADYLVRHNIITASSMKFERNYWGPLVSHREGLIDDGSEIELFSDGRDVVSFYECLPGDSAQWRTRAAFRALKALKEQVGNSHYLGAECVSRHLEIHRFKKDEGYLHVAWTSGGRIARFKDCFDEARFGQILSVVDRDGAALDGVPDFFGGSPIYILSDSSEHLIMRSSVRLPKKVIAARSTAGKRYYEFDSEKWQGMVMAGSREEAAVLN